MIETDPQKINHLLKSPEARNEAREIIAESIHKYGENIRFGMMPISTSPTTRSWVLVCDQEAARYRSLLLKEGLDAVGLRRLIEHPYRDEAMEVVTAGSSDEAVPEKYTPEYARYLYKKRGYN